LACFLIAGLLFKILAVVHGVLTRAVQKDNVKKAKQKIIAVVDLCNKSL